MKGGGGIMGMKFFKKGYTVNLPRLWRCKKMIWRCRKKQSHCCHCTLFKDCFTNPVNFFLQSHICFLHPIRICEWTFILLMKTKEVKIFQKIFFGRD